MSDIRMALNGIKWFVFESHLWYDAKQWTENNEFWILFLSYFSQIFYSVVVVFR